MKKKDYTAATLMIYYDAEQKDVLGVSNDNDADVIMSWNSSGWTGMGGE